MTSTAGRALTEAHRQAQLAVRARVVREVVAAWHLFDWRAIADTLPALVVLVDRAVADGRAASTRAALAYLARFRRVEGVHGARGVFDDPEPVDRSLVEATVRATGLASVLRLARLDAEAGGNLAPEVVRRQLGAGLVRLAGSTSRLALDAGRETIRRGVEADPAARGWVRVTGGRACEWCRLAAAEGVVRASERFGSHDHCSCTVEPVFGAYVERPSVARTRDLLAQARAERPDADPLNALRTVLPYR